MPDALPSMSQGDPEQNADGGNSSASRPSGGGDQVAVAGGVLPEERADAVNGTPERLQESQQPPPLLEV